MPARPTATDRKLYKLEIKIRDVESAIDQLIADRQPDSRHSANVLYKELERLFALHKRMIERS